MINYSEIDAILMPWAQSHGLHVYIGHRQNIVRSVTIYVWLGTRHESTGHIWIDPLNEMGLVGVHAAAGNFRWEEAVPLADLAPALDRASEKLMDHKRRAEAGRPQTSISPRI
jgi:hypothetical protein